MNKKDHNRSQSNARLVSITECVTDAIIVADKFGKIILWNQAAEKMFGYHKTIALGKNLSIIMPEEYRAAHSVGMSQFINSGEKKIIGTSIELIALKKNGSRFPIELSLSSWEEDDELFVCGIIRDITARKRKDEIIQSSLKEKDILLKEVHHRVKNNLQIIISLLKTYARKVPKESRLIFQECQDKIYSMALVHSSIYLSNDFEYVNLKEYIINFSNNYFSLMDLDNDILEKNLEDININMEYAVNFGLILSELLSNFHKHCIPVNNSPKLKISLKKCKKGILFEFEDNGVGIQPEIIDPNQPSSTYGIEMIKGLVSQVNGTLKINCSNGTKFSIRLNP